MTMTPEQKKMLLSNVDKVARNNMMGLVTHVVSGNVTVNEIKATGKLNPQSMNKLEDEIWSMAQHGNSEATKAYRNNYPKGKHAQELADVQKVAESAAFDDVCWDQCMAANRLDRYEQYLKLYPNGKHSQQALQNIRKLKDEEMAQKKQQYIDAISRDPNAYSVEVLSQTPDGLRLTADDFRCCTNIPPAVFETWGRPKPNFNLGKTPDAIPKGYTEIYFWGMPGSGKTCTLAAILSQAKKHGLIKTKNEAGSGNGYLMQLSNIFMNEGSTLPASTQTDTTQYLPFQLKDSDGQHHNVALVEISGEIFKCFSCMVQGRPMDSFLTPTYNSLLKFLQDTSNPKYHFFVIDITQNSVDENGLTQQDYLQDAATYMQDNKILSTRTAGIHCITTKSDLLSPNTSQRIDIARKHLEDKYRMFIGTLRETARECKVITDQEGLPLTPFSIGDIYFQDKCMFDPEMADVLIALLQESTSMNQRKSGISKFMNK